MRGFKDPNELCLESNKEAGQPLKHLCNMHPVAKITKQASWHILNEL